MPTRRLLIDANLLVLLVVGRAGRQITSPNAAMNFRHLA